MKSFATLLVCCVALSLTLAAEADKLESSKIEIIQPPPPTCGCGVHQPPPPTCGCGAHQPPPPTCGCGETQHLPPKCGCSSPHCPPCNRKAGCPIWGCPCSHDGFTLRPGNEPLNAPRPAGCPKCVSKCDKFAIKCRTPFEQCSAEQVATYRCVEPIADDPSCPACNPKAGCRIWECPCTHDGYIMHPGYEPLNAPRPAWCPKCDSECDNYAIKCSLPYAQCSAEKVATYKCIEPIPVKENIFTEAVIATEA